MDLEHPAALAHEPHRVEQRLVGQSEVEDHERLRGRDAGLDRGGELGQRIVGVAGDREREAVVDRAVAVRRGAPLGQPGPQRSLGRRRRPRSGVVEREERGRAAVRGGHGILEEPVGLGVRGDPRVGVDVDHAGEDQHPGRLDHPAAPAAGPLRSGSIAVMTPPSTATSARRDPVAVTTVPPRMTRSVTGR